MFASIRSSDLSPRSATDPGADIVCVKEDTLGNTSQYAGLAYLLRTDLLFVGRRLVWQLYTCYYGR